MDSIIQVLLNIIQYQHQQICWLILFIAKYIPLKQWASDDSRSPKYQKFKVDKLPLVGVPKSEWLWGDFIEYKFWRYGVKTNPIKRRKECDISEECTCPRCGAPFPYLYKNNGSKGQIVCKVCDTRFCPQNKFSKVMTLRCPHCQHALDPKKDRKHFIVHKCVNPKCPFYLHNLEKVDPKDLGGYGKNKYKLHYIYRQFTVDFFKMDLDSLPDNAASFNFRKHSTHIMTLCLTFHVNLGLSLRKTSVAMKDFYNVPISHETIAGYARTAALLVKPFVDHYDYPTSDKYVGDETYTKVRGVKGYVWFIMDAVHRSIRCYQVSDNRGVGPCILAMRMAFRHLEKIPAWFKFIADGYSAYPLAAQQFKLQKKPLDFEITQVIGLSNDDAVSAEFRPYKQLVERLNRTFKESYRVKCGYDNFDGANYSVALWVAYYNFLRPHKSNGYRPLNNVEDLDKADTMPGKWQLLIYLGQQTILNLQKQQAEEQVCS